MPLIKDEYRAPLWVRNGHINSIYPYFFRKPSLPPYERQRWETPDGDFIDVDQLLQGSETLVILSHGLEGSSTSQYIISASQLFASHGWDVLAMNHRSCSGEINRSSQMYHSGFTKDLAYIIDKKAKEYQHVLLLGYSLGGNMISKYLGDQIYEVPENILAGIGVSVPTHLASGAKELGLLKNKIFTYGFLRTLIPKALEKASQFPELLDSERIKKIKTLVEFDDVVTGPLHGFENAMDYYEQCSSVYHLENIVKPLLMINALDDPFLGKACFPSDIAQASHLFHLNTTKFGGHVGFHSNSTFYYPELKALDFANQLLKRMC